MFSHRRDALPRIMFLIRAEAAISRGVKMLPTVLFETLLSAVTAFAQLGETPDQCQMRYGLG